MKETLQMLAPAVAAASQAASGMQPAQAEQDEDAVCIICLDQPSNVVFQPCSHCVTCEACAQLVVQARQPCPLCRGPSVSIRP